MGIETLHTRPTETAAMAREVLQRSDEAIRAEIKGIIAATTLAEAREERVSFEEIGTLFAETNDERVLELQRQKQELVLEAMLDNPADAIRAEFLQLKLLYEGRSLVQTQPDGSSDLRFCTQDHENARPDSMFREHTAANGSQKFEIRKVFTYTGESRLGTITWQDGQISVTQQGWERGRTVDYELEGDSRDRMLSEVFYDTIQASSLQFERQPSVRAENDDRAKHYLLEAMRTQSSLL